MGNGESLDGGMDWAPCLFCTFVLYSRYWSEGTLLFVQPRLDEREPSHRERQLRPARRSCYPVPDNPCGNTRAARVKQRTEVEQRSFPAKGSAPVGKDGYLVMVPYTSRDAR
jgi:hypothetical protein